MSKIIPSLVDKSLLDSIIQKNTTSINMPQLPLPKVNLSKFDIKNFITKYWIILTIVLGITIFIVYNYYNKKEKEKQKELFTQQNKKKRKQKKVRIDTYDSNTTCASCKKSGSSHCPSCSQGSNFEGKMSEVDTGIRDLQTDVSYQPSRDNNEHFQEHNEQQQYQQEQYPQEQYQQEQYQQYQRENDYHNQFYGQSITEEAQGGFGGGLETFNSSSGNYVAF